MNKNQILSGSFGILFYGQSAYTYFTGKLRYHIFGNPAGQVSDWQANLTVVLFFLLGSYMLYLAIFKCKK